MREQTSTVNGIRMRWEETGDGPPIIYIHGIPTSPRLWRHVIPQVDGARSLAWEMVGYGGSIDQGRERDISVARQAEYLIRWMDDRELDRAILVGHDLGGGVAQIAATNHPDRVSGLVLTNAISYDSWPIPSVIVMRALGPIVRLLPNSIFRLIYTTFLHQGHDDRARAKESVGEHWPFYEQADGAAAFIRQVRSLDVRDTQAITSDLPRLDIPARLVWGAADPFQPMKYAERLARDLDAPLDSIEGGLHFVPEDHPDRVADAVQSLLDEVHTE
jgi:pimeloyl-ACP methyl ester carboxylesterase